MRIGQPGAPAAAARRVAARRCSEGFAVADDAADDAPDVPAASAPAPAQAVVLLSAAPAGGRQADPAADRQAAGHGRAMLGALAGLQAATLGGGGAAAHQALAELTRAVPEAADPGLSAVLQAIAQRAAVELARSE